MITIDFKSPITIICLMVIAIIIYVCISASVNSYRSVKNDCDMLNDKLRENERDLERGAAEANRKAHELALDMLKHIKFLKRAIILGIESLTDAIVIREHLLFPSLAEVEWIGGLFPERDRDMNIDSDRGYSTAVIVDRANKVLSAFGGSKDEVVEPLVDNLKDYVGVFNSIHEISEEITRAEKMLPVVTGMDRMSEYADARNMLSTIRDLDASLRHYADQFLDLIEPACRDIRLRIFDSLFEGIDFDTVNDNKPEEGGNENG